MVESDAESGTEAISKYGHGQKDPNTGLYEWYELPKERNGEVGTPVSWLELLNEWALIEALFHTEFQVDLSKVLYTETWRWFTVRVRLLLRTDNPLSRHFAPDDEPTAEVPDVNWAD